MKPINKTSDTDKLVDLADTISREIYGDPEAWKQIGANNFVSEVVATIQTIKATWQPIEFERPWVETGQTIDVDPETWAEFKRAARLRAREPIEYIKEFVKSEIKALRLYEAKRRSTLVLPSGEISET